MVLVVKSQLFLDLLDWILAKSPQITRPTAAGAGPQLSTAGPQASSRGAGETPGAVGETRGWEGSSSNQRS